MWIVYRKADKTPVGTTADHKKEISREQALKEIIEQYASSDETEAHDALQITDLKEITRIRKALRFHLESREKDGLEIVIDEPKIAYLQLKSDAADTHPVDGVPEIKADGSSFTIVTIQKTDADGNPLQRNIDNDLLYLRTDYGKLASENGKNEIDRIKLAKGSGAFRLISEQARRLARVDVFNADDDIQDAYIRIEFI